MRPGAGTDVRPEGHDRSPPASSVAVAAVAEESLVRPRIRALLLEDNASDALLVRSALEALPAEVVVTVDRESFERALGSERFDVVVSDYRLPDMTGEDAFERVRREAPETPFILVTGTLGEERAVELLKRGITDFVLKRNLARLPAAVLRALEEVKQRSERRRAEEELDAERRFLKALLETMNESIVACDASGRLSLFNRAARALHGLPAEPVPSGEWARRYGLFAMDGVTELTEEQIPLFRALQGESVEDVEMKVALSSEEAGTLRTVSASGRPILDEQGRKMGAVVAMRDVTEQKSLEEQLRHAQKMEAIGRLAGGVAHDFNNLLTAILGYAELVQVKLGPRHAATTDVEEILAAGQRAASLTKQLLTFSRMEVTAPQLVDLNAALVELERMLKRLIGEDVQVITALAPSLWPVVIDPGQITQVVMNLAVNARDAMPQGGKLVIETRNVELSGEYARHHVEAEPGEYVMLSVSDTGSGMDASVRSRIFEPFFTTKEKGRGTGLGLSTVYGIVKQAGGNVVVYSEPGKGSTFKVYLPRTEALPRRAVSHASLKAIAGGETILLVEDEEGVRRLTCLALQDQGYSVLEAANGAEALRIAAEPHDIRLVLTDGVMPDMSGRELVTLLSQRLPDCKFLIMSGYTDEAIVHHGLLDGGTAFLPKPFTPRVLSRKVREVLDSD